LRVRSRRALLGVATLAVAASGTLGVGISAGFGRGASHHDTGGYGGLPRFLPTSTLHPDSVLDGSAAHPALTSEGDGVRVRLRHGSALIVVAGPVVPGEGLPFQASADTATWTVTLSKARGRVPISPRAFTTIDSLGKIYHPAFVAGQPRPPSLLRPGRTAQFELRAVMAVGEGMMRWAPVGNDLVATWDFEVEND
jgi:hypothetical protein